MMTEIGPLKTNQWEYPKKHVLSGTYCRLEPLGEVHFKELHEVRSVEDESTRYRYLMSCPPLEWEAFVAHMKGLMDMKDRVHYAVIDQTSGRAEGFQCYLNIVPTYGSIEIGGILWGPKMARSRMATEAFYLCSVYALDELKYRRYEWKCNNDNEKSKHAALRFGFQFEGILRNHLIQQGWNRNTAYFSILDSEWPHIKQALEQWLHIDNFDTDGIQKRTLQSFITASS